jgi:hypothetical protein
MNLIEGSAEASTASFAIVVRVGFVLPLLLMVGGCHSSPTDVRSEPQKSITMEEARNALVQLANNHKAGTWGPDDLEAVFTSKEAIRSLKEGKAESRDGYVRIGDRWGYDPGTLKFWGDSGIYRVEGTFTRGKDGSWTATYGGSSIQ